MKKRKTALILGLAALAIAALALLLATRRPPSRTGDIYVAPAATEAPLSDTRTPSPSPDTGISSRPARQSPRSSPINHQPSTINLSANALAWPLPAASEALLPAPRREIQPSQAVLSIAGLGPDRNDQKARRAAINKLTVNLTPDDIAALIDFLLVPHDEDSGVDRVIYNTLRNDVLEVLVRQETLPDGLGGLMVAMARNPDEDEVWRDYSIQYMAEYYRRRWRPDTDAENDPDGRDERLQMLAAYREALDEKDATLAGTALIGFESLSRLYPETGRSETADRALNMAEDEERSAASRLTALRVCAALGERRALDAARMLAQTGATVPLRMAAIATLGDLGDPEDIPLLQAMLGAAEPGIARIAETALARLQTAIAAANHGGSS